MVKENLETLFSKFYKEFVSFKDDMLDFKNEMYDFRDDMLKFKEETRVNFKKVNIKIEEIEETLSSHTLSLLNIENANNIYADMYQANKGLHTKIRCKSI